MCGAAGGTAADAALAAPRPALGEAVDPIGLEPVDEVVVTTLVDNVYDALLAADERTTRVSFGVGLTEARQFEGGETAVGLRAEHGFSALVTVRRDQTTTSLLFDTGVSPDAMVVNADRLGVDLLELQGVVLSHGHFDHAGGLAGLATKLGSRSMPMVVHPVAWTRRRLAVPGAEPLDMPTLSRRALEAEGFALVERRLPSLLVDGCVLITGEVDRTTEFERGMPPAHEAWTGSEWRHDPDVVDDQALVVHVRGRGLVVLTGCGHAGAVNIVRHAQRLTGVSSLAALVGGLHLSGPAFEPVIPPTVDALTAMAPGLVVPGHCTGWRAQHALAAALPEAWTAGSSGSSYRVSAA
jgi:7,8-dihydropterin-6-yl-methyl-4-(beta-D-ribofuranosyl)aminobenzene 5'-phosphate synthase